uniref:(northern house mosquito) hypothetical protein n=1 Tax=Culex pipiens TaxID=7175 RepID=A0A8D8FK06_CULPI
MFLGFAGLLFDAVSGPESGLPVRFVPAAPVHAGGVQAQLLRVRGSVHRGLRNLPERDHSTHEQWIQHGRKAQPNLEIAKSQITLQSTFFLLHRYSSHRPYYS